MCLNTGRHVLQHVCVCVCVRRRRGQQVASLLFEVGLYCSPRAKWMEPDPPPSVWSSGTGPPSQIQAPTPNALAPSKEQLANGRPIKQARTTSPHLWGTLVRAERECVTHAKRGAYKWWRNIEIMIEYCVGIDLWNAQSASCVSAHSCACAGSGSYNSLAMTLAILVAFTYTDVTDTEWCIFIS